MIKAKLYFVSGAPQSMCRFKIGENPESGLRSSRMTSFSIDTIQLNKTQSFMR